MKTTFGPFITDIVIIDVPSAAAFEYRSFITNHPVIEEFLNFVESRSGLSVRKKLTHAIWTEIVVETKKFGTSPFRSDMEVMTKLIPELEAIRAPEKGMEIAFWRGVLEATILYNRCNNRRFSDG